MKFIKTYDLKPGMRLAKPIYNKNGVLLYERNTPLTLSGIKNVKNFGLIGIYILEPAEPLPPMTKEDIELEQNQTIYLFRLRDCFNQLLKQEGLSDFQSFINSIITKYGMLNHRVNFNQNLRSADDFIYKHAISTTILSAMISHGMGISFGNQISLVAAALLYDIGLSFVPRAILEKGTELDADEQDVVNQSLEKGLIYLELVKDSYSFMPKTYKLIENYIYSKNSDIHPTSKDQIITLLTNILKVADAFDTLTGMTLGSEPESEISAMKILANNPAEYDKDIVSVLGQCIHIVPAGASVDLSNNDKGVVLAENTGDFMKPLILRLSDNQVYDLNDPEISEHIKIIDLMKTMDNRIEIDEHTLKQFVADDRIHTTATRFRRVLYGHD